MDGVGAGDKISALCAENFPDLWSYINKANEKYTHRLVFPRSFSNLGRPRLDAARFLWAGVPSLSFSAFGTTSYYHVTKDNIDIITPEIMEDLAQMLFMGVLELANQDQVDFRKEDL
jgi:Iap family predicted aminopeptidase